jgi:hypothetical protein
LYELQRKRLEKSIETLTDEKDLWIKACYSLGLKCLYENRLSTAKQLNISEKSWYKLAKQFSLLLSDNDLKCLNDIQTLIENWKLTLEVVRKNQIEKETQTRKAIQQLQFELKQLRATLGSSDTL